jgi:hypothetical protein
LAELTPLTLKKKGNFQFTFFITPTVVHIQLKLKIWICYKNALVKFRHGLMIGDRVIPLELWKKKSEILSVIHYLPNGCTHSTQI